MPELVDSKTFCPSHQAPTKLSEMIASLQNLQDTYGDLSVEICTHGNNGVTRYADIFYAHNLYDDGTSDISVQSFPY